MENNEINNIKPVYIFQKDIFIDRSFHEVDGGDYDNNGFYITPEGSFWDLEGNYFNKYGYDRNGGEYNGLGIYLPGEGWNEEFECYEEDITKELQIQEIEDLDQILQNEIQNLNISHNSDIGENELVNESYYTRLNCLNSNITNNIDHLYYSNKKNSENINFNEDNNNLVSNEKNKIIVNSSYLENGISHEKEKNNDL